MDPLFCFRVKQMFSLAKNPANILFHGHFLICVFVFFRIYLKSSWTLLRLTWGLWILKECRRNFTSLNSESGTVQYFIQCSCNFAYPKRETYPANPILLPNNLAQQQYSAIPPAAYQWLWYSYKAKGNEPVQGLSIIHLEAVGKCTV